MRFPLFVYGTLKQGQRNFERYCRGALAVEPACVLGRLYYLAQGLHLSYGYPMLDIPPGRALALGSADYLADAALLERLACSAVAPAPVLASGWELIAGEVLTFDDPLERLPKLDALEDFRPGEASLYHRVAVQLCQPRGKTVWTYVAANHAVPESAVRIGPCWP